MNSTATDQTENNEPTEVTTLREIFSEAYPQAEFKYIDTTEKDLSFVPEIVSSLNDTYFKPDRNNKNFMFRVNNFAEGIANRITDPNDESQSYLMYASTNREKPDEIQTIRVLKFHNAYLDNLNENVNFQKAINPLKANKVAINAIPIVRTIGANIKDQGVFQAKDPYNENPLVYTKEKIDKLKKNALSWGANSSVMTYTNVKNQKIMLFVDNKHL
ncbi:hypothetical protein KKA50_00615 [Patescibacteria group bacterium]|nr:hypothetical protein [Patescibacteria group bacterium]